MREIERPGVGPVGYVGAAPRPEAARHLGHPYIAKYSRVEKASIVRRTGTLLASADQESVETRDSRLLVTGYIVNVRRADGEKQAARKRADITLHPGEIDCFRSSDFSESANIVLFSI